MRKALLSTFVAIIITGGVTAPAFADSFRLEGAKDTGLAGVSPFAVNASGTLDRVFYSGGLGGGGWSLSLCSLDRDCTGTTLPFGFGTDYTQVTLADGSLRAYFVQPGAGSRSISTASVSYDAAGNPQLGPTTDLGFSAPVGQKAWGVPDSVVLPDGRVRLYWVTTPTEPIPTGIAPTKKQLKCLEGVLGKNRVAAINNGSKILPKDRKALSRCKISRNQLTGSHSKANEVIVSATSTDATGTQFVADPGYRFTGGYVDSDVIQANTGNWIALVSTGPGSPPQRLYVATSKDGMTWSVDKTPLTSPATNSLDPSAVPTGPKSWRVYYSESPADDPFNNHRIVVGTLTRK